MKFDASTGCYIGRVSGGLWWWALGGEGDCAGEGEIRIMLWEIKLVGLDLDLAPRCCSFNLVLYTHGVPFYKVRCTSILTSCDQPFSSR